MGKDEIEGHAVSKLLAVAENAVKQKTAESLVLDTEAEARIPKFDYSELKFGKVLGRGGFCVVHEVPTITLAEGSASRSAAASSSREEDEHRIHNIVQDRAFMATHYIREGKDFRYAVKTVQESAKKGAQLFVNAVVDLAIEARFLAVIRHPNIIKMRAMASSSPFDGKYFLVLDKLFDILSARLKTWKKKMPGKLARMTANGKRSIKEFWAERLTVVYDLSCAMKYMHDMHIMYRDIKPDNIGFDVRGDVKIFDFGLAKEYQPEKRGDDGTFKYTADTGSPRYMAPEVFLGQPYNETCDVYSFSILAWQILKLETPFEGYTGSMMIKSVYKGGARPKPDPAWSADLQEALRKGWDSTVQSRCSMEDLSEILRDIISKETDEELEDAIDASRKSDMSARGMRQ
mmetsp:Transcript_2549/g.5212  ORF Transcript_2549/g.5212 Transcript_2549/m.5212 type:complete len:403 (-) Transcript_2549:210-1418(-)|eukprot:CAMPEP_0172460768 /NCGR_PEP_ID=MMETSP1065-20121228/38197_1 /TAXON_ID=265537 /ORGANISM="Amphiprora paludosa, Strain CCMP125" /LENGTH=402 /DNA_ID=CAMNT_0013215901 /DNA_START=133 /DNA_END=1341 /DNA_ORIENTATION=-